MGELTTLKNIDISQLTVTKLRDRHLQLADEMIRKLNEELKQQKSVNKHGLAENANLRVQLAVSHTQHPIRFEYFFRIVSEHVNR